MGEQRRVVLFIATSLDGYIARRNGDIDWLFSDQDYGYKELAEKARGPGDCPGLMIGGRDCDY